MKGKERKQNLAKVQIYHKALENLGQLGRKLWSKYGPSEYLPLSQRSQAFLPDFAYSPDEASIRKHTGSGRQLCAAEVDPAVASSCRLCTVQLPVTG